eukprot:6195176-Pleurochrysis_carterae.AAC.2
MPVRAAAMSALYVAAIPGTGGRLALLVSRVARGTAALVAIAKRRGRLCRLRLTHLFDDVCAALRFV